MPIKKKSNKSKGIVVVKKTPEFLAKSPKAKLVTLKKDKDGFFVGGGRGRSKSKKTIGAITKTEIEWVESTM